MSTVSGLASKADKDKGSKQKYSSLNINNLYKGKSLEANKSIAPAKHGLQTLGKVGAGRRLPPSVNLTTLSSDKSQAKSSSNGSVSQPATAWGDKSSQNSSDDTSKKLLSAAAATISVSKTISGSSSDPSLSESNVSKGSASQSNQSSKAWAANNKSTSSAASGGGGGGPNAVVQLVPEEFPSLDATESHLHQPKNSNKEQNTYGPGPSLRPQMNTDWTRSSASQTNQSLGESTSASFNTDNPPQRIGNGANEYEQSGRLTNGTDRPYGSHHNYNNHNNRHSNFGPNVNESNSTGSFQPGYNRQQQAPRFSNNSGPNAIDRRTHQQRIRDEQAAKVRAQILTESDLKGFDDLIENGKLEDWTRARNKIDFNAKLNFSDDDEDFATSNSRNLIQNDEDDEFAEANSHFLRETGRLNAEEDSSKNKIKSESASNDPDSNKNRRDQEVRRLPSNRSSENLRNLDSKNRAPSDFEYTNKSQLDRESDKRELNRSFNREGFSSNNSNSKSFPQKVLPPRFQRLQQQNTNVRPDNRSVDNSNGSNRKRSDSEAPSDAPPTGQRRILTRDPNWRRNDNQTEQEPSVESQQSNESPANKLTSESDSASTPANTSGNSSLKTEASDSASGKEEKPQSVGLFDRNSDWSSEYSSTNEPVKEQSSSSTTVHAAPIQISSKQFEFVADSIQNKTSLEEKSQFNRKETNDAHQPHSNQTNASNEFNSHFANQPNPIKEERRVRRDYSKRDEQLKNDQAYESKVNTHIDSSSIRNESRFKHSQEYTQRVVSESNDVSSELLNSSQSKMNTINLSASNQSNFTALPRQTQQSAAREQRRFDRPSANATESTNEQDNALINQLIENSIGNPPQINNSNQSGASESAASQQTKSVTLATSLSHESNESSADRVSTHNNNSNNSQQQQQSIRSLPRSYGPPPSKAAFGEQLRSNSNRKNSESSDNGLKSSQLDQMTNASAVSSSGQSSFSAISMEHQKYDKEASRRNNYHNNGNNNNLRNNYNNNNNNNRRQVNESCDENMRNNQRNNNRYTDRSDYNDRKSHYSQQQQQQQQRAITNKDLKSKMNGSQQQQQSRRSFVNPDSSTDSDFKSGQRKQQQPQQSGKLNSSVNDLKIGRDFGSKHEEQPKSERLTSNNYDSKLEDNGRNENDLQTNSLALGLSNVVVSEQLDNKPTDSFALSKAPGSGSRVVGASRNIGRNSPSLLSNDANNSNSDDLNLKIASVKNIWESINSMSNVLDISGDDNSTLDHDSRKLKSPGRNDLNIVASSGSSAISSTGTAVGSMAGSVNSSSVHAMQQMQPNVSQHQLLGSSGFVFPSMKPIGGDEQLKKSLYSMSSQASHVLGHQLAHSQQAQHMANQQSHHHAHNQPQPQQQQQQQQMQPNQSMLMSSSPPNLLNHLGASSASLDNRRSFAVNQFSSMGNMPRISSPSAMLYNTNNNQQQAPNQVPQPNPSMNNPAAHAAAAAHVNMYQFANQIKGMSQQGLMAQFAAAAAVQQHHSHPFAAVPHHAAMFQQQRGQQMFPQAGAQMNNPNASSTANQAMNTNAGQSQPNQNNPTPDYCLHPQTMAASHLLKQRFVQVQQIQAVVAAAAAANCPQPGANQPPPPPVGSAAFYATAPPPTQAAVAAQKAYYTAQASNASASMQHLQNSHSQQHSHLAPGQQLAGPPTHVPQGPPNAQYGNFLPQFGLLGQAQSQMPSGQFRQSKRSNMINQNNVSYS